MKNNLMMIAIASFSFFPLISIAYAADTLVGLGDLAGGSFSSSASGVNSDGSVAVGQSDSASGVQAFRWTQVGGMAGLGDLAGGGFNSIATAVNSDGSVVVGQSASASGSEAFRWTQAGGMIGLGDLAGGGFYSFANAINSDGSVIVGLGISASGVEAFRWTQVGGMVGLGDLAGGSFSSNPYDVNSDGSVIVGESTSINGNEGFRWTQAGGMVGLGDLAGGGFYSIGRGVNSDGSVVVGQSNSTSGAQAFRWTQVGGMVGLGDLAGGGFNSIANAVNSDGSVVVGQSASASGSEAFRWTQAGGMERVQDWLTSAGVNTSAFSSLDNSYDVSADGSVIIGVGTNTNGTEAFLARVSSNGSGILDPVSTNKSAAETKDVLSLAETSISITLNGAHHRPLIIDNNIPNKNSCMWATADAGYLGSGRNGYITSQEVGLCTDTLGGQVRIGMGLGNSKSIQDSSYGGEQKIDGQYGLLEANYRPNDTNLILSLTGIYGRSEASINRGYLNAGTPDISKGDADIKSTSVRASVYWTDAAEIAAFKLSPKLSYTASSLSMNRYEEVGGGFPVSFHDQKSTTQEIRIGVDAKKELDTNTDLHLMFEAIHKPKSEGDGVSGNLIGLYSFDFINDIEAETWMRANVDIDHRFENGISVGVSLFAASSGQVDPDISGALTIKSSF